jgi:ABC-2 type transport system permease protein
MKRFSKGMLKTVGLYTCRQTCRPWRSSACLTGHTFQLLQRFIEQEHRVKWSISVTGQVDHEVDILVVVARSM